MTRDINCCEMRGFKLRVTYVAVSVLGCLCVLIWYFMEEKSYVCQTFNGRLGNHIFQYASIYGISTLNDLTIILGKDDDLVHYFKVPSATVRKNREICEKFVHLEAEHSSTFEKRLTNLTANTNYVLGLYLQSWKYFGHEFNGVRNELKFKPHIQVPATYIVENYRDTYTTKFSIKATVVGVHIRRGDKETNPIINEDGENLPPDSYFRHAVEYFEEKYPLVVFIVCSDGMDYAKRVMTYKAINVHFVYQSPIEDMAVLASCDHVIMSVGSFGWWSGFLSGGTVVYYKYPTREGTHAFTEYNYDDFFPRHWIGLA